MFAEPPPVRLALALGDQELEQRLRPALETTPEVELAAHCLAADQLLEVVQARQVDAVVAAWGLHRLTDGVLAQLERSRLPVLLLVPEPDHPRWTQRSAVVLPMHVDAGALVEAIEAAGRGERRLHGRTAAPAAPASIRTPNAPAPQRPSVIAVAGGAGSPGRTTMAINLATALGAVEATVLVDADFANPAVAAYLDADPSRNVCTLAHAVRESPHLWDRVLEDELQLLHPLSRGGRVLCGLPKREMRSSVSPATLERVVGELSARFRYVVLDVGAELLGIEPGPMLHRSALQLAQHVLLVTAPDLVGLWHARSILAQLEQQLEIGREGISLVINRHDARHHHTRAEIEWHLGYASAAIVPHDYVSLQRAVAGQYPVVTDSRSRAARAVLDLAERVHRGRVRLPAADATRAARNPWSHLTRAAQAASLRWRAPAGRGNPAPLAAERGRGSAW